MSEYGKKTRHTKVFFFEGVKLPNHICVFEGLKIMHIVKERGHCSIKSTHQKLDPESQLYVCHLQMVWP